MTAGLGATQSTPAATQSNAKPTQSTAQWCGSTALEPPRQFSGRKRGLPAATCRRSARRHLWDRRPLTEHPGFLSFMQCLMHHGVPRLARRPQAAGWVPAFPRGGLDYCEGTACPHLFLARPPAFFFFFLNRSCIAHLANTCTQRVCAARSFGSAVCGRSMGGAALVVEGCSGRVVAGVFRGGDPVFSLHFVGFKRPFFVAFPHNCEHGMVQR